MGWKRRFGNRAEIDSSPSDEILPDVEDNIPLGRPYLLNNKIYPGLQEQESLKEKAEDLRKREVQLQKIICILLCTIFPLLTTVATILRLWHTGVLSFSSSETAEPRPCPQDWLNHSQLCLQQFPTSLNWSQAEQSCRDLGGNLPNNSNSNKLNLYLVSKCQTPLWLGRMKISAESNNRSSWQQCEYLSDTATVEKTSCSKKMTGVCTRTASLNG